MNPEQQKTFERYSELVHKKFITGFDSDSESDELEALDEEIDNAGYEGFYNNEENPYPQLTEAYSTWQYGYEQAESRTE